MRGWDHVKGVCFFLSFILLVKVLTTRPLKLSNPQLWLGTNKKRTLLGPIMLGEAPPPPLMHMCGVDRMMRSKKTGFCNKQSNG